MILLVPTALANGLTTHVTISLEALPLLPEGELREFLTDPAVQDALVNGTQFPDGGYAVGDNYGEIAHWEPFQQHVREWLLAQSEAPWESEPELLAFNLGQASHGMGDQVFDSLYMERAKVYDIASDWAGLSMDQATDVALAAITGGQPTPGEYLPTDVLVPRFAEIGHVVDADTLESGQLATNVAILWVQNAGQNPDDVAEWSSYFPWATEHILDREVAGNPYDEAMVVARYWQVLWARLHGEVSFYEPVMATFPADGALGHPSEMARVESRVTVVMSRGISASLLDAQFFTVTDETGASFPVEPWLFYGESSHVVHLLPGRDWDPDMDYTVTVAAGIAFIDGTTSQAPYTFGFSTRQPPDEVAPESAVPTEGCGCGGGSAPSLLLALIGTTASRRLPGRRRSSRTT